MKPLLALSVLVQILICGNVLAQSRAASQRLFGWELEFTNAKVSNALYGAENAQANSVNDAAREKWYRIVKALCAGRGDCRIKEIEDWVSWRKGDGEVVWSWEIASYRVLYKDGFWFQLSYDPGVVEVQMKPCTPAEYRRNVQRMQDDLFATAAKAGLKPKRHSETHVHIGAQAAFKLNLKLIRNFLVDGVNHPEWTFLFADGLHNAPPMILLPEEKYEAFAEIIAAVDDGSIKDIATFVKQIRKKVYDVTFDPDMIGEGYDPAQKFQEWNIERLKKAFKDHEKTLEHRAMPAPQNAEDLADLTELVDARIAFVLKKGSRPLKLLPYQAKLSKQEQVTRFEHYVTEAGADIDIYRRFLRKSCERYLTSP